MSIANPFKMEAEETAHKYTFQLELKKIYINPSFPFDVKIVWARNDNRIQTQNVIKLQPPEHQVALSECFCNKSTVVFHPKSMEFRKKQSKLQVILYANGSPKQGGDYTLNLCQILDPFNIRAKKQKTYRVVTRNEKPRCELQFVLKAEYCQQMVKDEQRSIGSGVGSISSKNTTSLGHGLSGISNPLEAKQYVQKKNLFLYEAPSKDNQSVTSYNSYSTSMMRYNSGKKEREDSVRKEEYGISGTTRRDTGTSLNTEQFFGKTIGGSNAKPPSSTLMMPTGLSNDYETRSKTGLSSYNRVTQQNTQDLMLKPGTDNKTQSFQQNTSKQLQQQQAKRSKLQAQVSRLNIYMKQQTNKLTQFVQQNTRLKQQLSRASNQSNVKEELCRVQEELTKTRRDNEDMHNRLFELNNQNRELHRRVEQAQSFEQEMRRLKMQKQRAEVKLQSMNRNMQSIINSRQSSTVELQHRRAQMERFKDQLQHRAQQAQNLRDQLEHTKSLNANLRQQLQQERHKTQQLTLTNSYSKQSIQQQARKKDQRLYELQRENTTLMAQMRDRDKEIQGKKQLVYRLERTNTEYKDRIVQGDTEKTKLGEQTYKLREQSQKMRRQLSYTKEQSDKAKRQAYSLREENEKVKRQLSYLTQAMQKMKQQQTTQHSSKTNMLQNQLHQLQSQHYQTTQRLSKTQQELQLSKRQFQTSKQDIQQKINQIHRLQINLKNLRQFENKYYGLQKLYSQKQKQLNVVKGDNSRLVFRVNELEQSASRLTRELEELRAKAKSMPNVDVNEILRESVQLQVELKFKTDELLRLKEVQASHQELLYKLDIESRNNKDLESDLEKLQKQLKDKNKFYLIEVQKGKLLMREKLQTVQESQQIKAQLKRCQQIIYNGDRQVKQMQSHIQCLQGDNARLVEKINSLQRQLQDIRQKLSNTQKLQQNFSQVTQQLNEKTSVITSLNVNLTNYQNRIHELQQILQSKHSEAQQAINSYKTASQKLLQLESSRSSYNSQLQRTVTQKKALQLKCETIMQELHSLKKQFEDEKVRSTSIVSIRSNEDQVRIRQLQNELDKKDKAISKLTKQKLQIQEQNINLHVQVMKKLSEMEKTKDSDSSKNIMTPK